MLALRYAFFALIATAANLASQRGVFAIVPPGLAYVPALAVGTGVGLVVKYLLDRRWIFYDQQRSLASHGKQFSLYTLTGVATTLVFWASETGFWLAFHSFRMAEVGAALGLTLGYLTKYQLDRRFVFSAKSAGAGG